MSIVSEAINEHRLSQRSVTAAGRRKRKTFLKLALIGLSVVVTLIVIEVTMRAFDLGTTRTLVWYHNRILKLPPHARFMNYKENRNLVETNNWGFHDRDRAATNDAYRILFLGDSFVEGRHVKTESLFTSRLEQTFSRGERKIEAINGGVPGTGTAYQYVLWKEFFEPEIKLDRIVLCFFMGNDLLDNNSLLSEISGVSDSGIFVDGEGNILDVGEKPGMVKRAINIGRDKSVLANVAYESIYRVRAGLQQVGQPAVNGETVAGKRDGEVAAWHTSEKGTIALIKKWQAELSGKKIPFDIVIIDRPGKVYNKVELQFLSELEATCSQDRIGYLRLQLEGDPYKFYSFDGISLGHFNEQGHETAANEIYRYLETHYLTPPASAGGSDKTDAAKN